jgi:hypothetical protein
MLAPRTVEEGESSFIVVHTANNFVVSITYFDDEVQRDFKSTQGRSAADCRCN